MQRAEKRSICQIQSFLGVLFHYKWHRNPKYPLLPAWKNQGKYIDWYLAQGECLYESWGSVGTQKMTKKLPKIGDFMDKSPMTVAFTSQTISYMASIVTWSSVIVNLLKWSSYSWSRARYRPEKWSKIDSKIAVLWTNHLRQFLWSSLPLHIEP